MLNVLLFIGIMVLSFILARKAANYESKVDRDFEGFFCFCSVVSLVVLVAMFFTWLGHEEYDNRHSYIEVQKAVEASHTILDSDTEENGSVYLMKQIRSINTTIASAKQSCESLWFNIWCDDVLAGYELIDYKAIGAK